MAIRITALGTLRVERDGQILDRLPAQRIRCAVLLFLGIEREASRDRLMGMFWGDRPPERARRLLSQALYELRQDIGDLWMETAGDQIRATDALTVDVVEFDAAVEEGRFADALEQYGGAFLKGATLAVSREFEGWIDREQARLTRLHRRARRGAIDEAVAAGRLEGALAMARAWVELDALDDEAQHRLIELLAATGDRSGALRQYDRYAHLVRTELELEPLEQTRVLVEQIRDGGVGARTAPPVAPSADASAAAPAESAGPDRSPAEATPRTGGPERRRQDGEEYVDLAHRPVVRWTLAYLPVALILAWAAEGATGRFGWPAIVPRVFILLLGFGGLLVLGAGWLWGGSGDRRVRRVEAALTVAVVVLAGAALHLARVPGPVLEANEAALDPRRIAVLYFDDMSPKQDLEPLAAGFTEALIHELGQVPALDVLSRTAVAPYRKQPVPLDSINADLEAGTLVEGSITRLEDRIRVTVQLIDGETASHILSATVEAQPDSLTRLLEALPRQVSLMLRKRLGNEIRVRETRLATRSGHAWELVQRALRLTADAVETRETDLEPALRLLDRADSMLAEAERLDPDWPEPLIRRADVAAHKARALADIPSTYEEESTRLALGHLQRVLDRWPDHAPALQERGILRFQLAEAGHGEDVEWLYRAAEGDLRRAVTLDDRLARAWWGLSQLLHRKDSYGDAKRAAERALEADAFLAYSLDNLFHLFWVYFDDEEHNAARQWCDELGKRYPDKQQWGYCELLLLTSAEPVTPDVERAWFFADTIVALATEKSKPVYRGYTALQVAKVLVRSGQLDSARKVFERVVPEPPPSWAAYDAAHFMVMTGEYDRALDYLELYKQWNPVRARSLGNDWWFAPLHEYERFRSIAGLGPG